MQNTTNSNVHFKNSTILPNRLNNDQVDEFREKIYAIQSVIIDD